MAARSMNLTLPPEAKAALAALAAEDAAATHSNPNRQKTATMTALIFAERDRRARRAQKKNATP